MSVTIREPGSAITHFIGMMMAILASTPLLIKAVLSGQPVIFFAMVVFIASMILLYGASATYHSINAGGRILRRRLLHARLSGHPGRKAGLHAACGGVGRCHPRHGGKGILDHLPEMVLLRDLHRHGLDLSGGFRPAVEYPSPRSLPVAACRRADLYGGRHHLCAEAAPFQREA